LEFARRMKTLDKTIQRWCLVSIDDLRGERDDLAAERIVEVAVFLKLAKGRGVNLRSESLSADFDGLESNDLFNRLIESCPLDQNSPPEVLGSIHETVVSHRQAAVNLEHSPVRHSRKVHGIFYTPQPVIDYMLRHTLTAKLTAADDQSDAIRIL